MNNYFIYKIVFPNDKHYIGLSTRTLDERKKEHLRQAKKPKKIVHKALKRFEMMDTFELILIDDSAKSIDELYEKEKFYIQQYNSYYKNKKGYNQTLGGEGNHGYVFTIADRKKMSQKAIEQFSKPEAREQMSQKLIEYFKNPEARDKSSKAQVKRFSNPEAREQMSQIKKKQLSKPEARQRLSQLKNEHYKNNPETRDKLSKAQVKRFSNPEQRENMSQIKKEYYKNNPKAGKVHGEKMKALYENNPEAKEKARERTIRQFSNPEAKKREKHKKLFKVFRKHNMEFIKEFEFQFEAIEYIKKEFNINIYKISEVLNKKRKSTGGFVFKYV